MEFLTQAGRLLDQARRRNIRLTTAESCTGGLLAGAITEAAGSSDIFERGYVTYSNSAKVEMLGVQAKSLAEFGAVSEVVAAEMAAGALDRSGADIAVSVTGIAGPGGSDNKPEGRVCFALARRGNNVISETREFTSLGRSKVRAASVAHALNLLNGALR